jgi:catechol 2,3-dioxygenase-like lactoylglutathione lyase family enzyme
MSASLLTTSKLSLRSLSSWASNWRATRRSRERRWTEPSDSTVSEATSQCCEHRTATAEWELSKFHTPLARNVDPNPPVNTLGIRRIMFAVADLEAVLARLVAIGAELVGEVVQYEDTYRLCYVRGPEGIMIALAEELG